jgi:hypothetical protein
MTQQIIIFDNHKIPKKLRGKKLYLEYGIYVNNCFGEPIIEFWGFASSGKSSKSKRHIMRIKGYDKDLYLLPSEYSLVHKSDTGGQ